MSKIKIFAIVMLIPFVGYTAYTMAIAEQSLLSFGYELISRPDTAQVVIDLYIMAVLAIVWMYYDSKKFSTRWLWIPCALLTLIFVSVGPLVYILFRPNNAETVS